MPEPVARRQRLGSSSKAPKDGPPSDDMDYDVFYHHLGIL
jgi:hypothetical protein